MNRIINKDTAVPIGAAIVVCGFGATVAVGYNRIVDQLEELTESQYTLPAAAEKAARDALNNPTLIVADPRNPDKVMPNQAGLEYMRGLRYQTTR